MKIEVLVASAQHVGYALEISRLIKESAEKRGTGIASRPLNYFVNKIRNGHAVIALHKYQVVGFCAIETWSGDYVSNSGLIVSPDYRGHGIAKRIKDRIFELSLELFPASNLFTITTSQAVMKLNTSLGYQPTTFAALPQDEAFWAKCQGCKNHDILVRTERQYCLCTALVKPASEVVSEQISTSEEIVLPLPSKRIWKRRRRGLAG